MHVTETILLTGAGSQLSDAATEIVTGTNWWFGEENTFGLALKEWMTGAVVSTTLKGIVAPELLPEASVTVTVII